MIVIKVTNTEASGSLTTAWTKAQAQLVKDFLRDRGPYLQDLRLKSAVKDLHDILGMAIVDED